MNEEISSELALFIDYAVPEQDRQAALGFMRRHSKSPAHLVLLKEFYSSLPEAEEDAVIKVVAVAENQGTFLLGVSTTKGRHYLYCADLDQAVLVGDFERGIENLDVLLFFGYPANNEFMDALKTPAQYPDFISGSQFQEQELCPVCSVREGENHHFGCGVEVCPWCSGQLIRCNCRFEKMELDEISSESELAEFEQVLNRKGRIPFAKGQGPSYPVAGND